MLLSVNLNKIALLRNSRGSNYPNLENFAIKALDMGAEGITFIQDQIIVMQPLMMFYI